MPLAKAKYLGFLLGKKMYTMISPSDERLLSTVTFGYYIKAFIAMAQHNGAGYVQQHNNNAIHGVFEGSVVFE